MNTRKVFFVFSVVKGITSPRYARHNPPAPPSSREPRRPSERGRPSPRASADRNREARQGLYSSMQSCRGYTGDIQGICYVPVDIYSLKNSYTNRLTPVCQYKQGYFVADCTRITMRSGYTQYAGELCNNPVYGYSSGRLSNRFCKSSDGNTEVSALGVML